MTNKAIAIEASLYKKMKKYADIEWDDLINKTIKRMLEELEKENANESFLTMLASEEVLKRDWLSSEEDEAWSNL